MTLANSLKRDGIGRWRAVMLSFALAVMPLTCARADPLVVQLNEMTTVELDGNPSTGFRWEFDATASENANLVGVEDLGYAKRELAPGQRPVLGAPSKYQFRVTGAEVGTAKLVFNYIKGGDAPAKTQDVSIEVMGE